MDARTLRLVNLGEVLAEQHPDVDEVRQEDLQAFDETQLKEYYRSGGKTRPDNPSLEPDRWAFWKTKAGKEQVRLFCFHHGGGNISFFRQWMNRNEFPEHVQVVAVELPGRGLQRQARLFRNMQELVRNMLDAIEELLWDQPFVFFGHSLGALVAFELARELRRRGRKVPDHLVVSARAAPHLSLSDLQKPELHAIPNDEDFVREMQTWYQNPDLSKVLAVPELKDSAIRTLRADMELFETYVPCPSEPPLDVSMSAYAGEEDAGSSVNAVSEWQEHCTRSFHLRVFSGGHFYWRPDAQQLIVALTKVCEDVLQRTS